MMIRLSILSILSLIGTYSMVSGEPANVDLRPRTVNSNLIRGTPRGSVARKTFRRLKKSDTEAKGKGTDKKSTVVEDIFSKKSAHATIMPSTPTVSKSAKAPVVIKGAPISTNNGKGGSLKGKKTKDSKSKSKEKLTLPPSPTVAPSDSPFPAPSFDAPSVTRPPVTLSPSRSTPTVSPATNSPADLIIQQLTPIGLEYTVTEDRIPFRSEYLEVVELTRTYLDGFFKDQYDDIEMTKFAEFLVVYVGSTFNFGAPILIDYDSSAVFEISSAVIPTVEMLDRTLQAAFQGENLNGFIGMLQALPAQNVFSTTIFVNQTEPGTLMTSVPSSRSQSKSQQRSRAATATGVVAGAAGLMLLVTVGTFVRRQLTKEEDESGFFIKPVDENITVTGETYTGTWSLGMGSFPEQASDSNSLRSGGQVLGEKQKYRDIDEGPEGDSSDEEVPGDSDEPGDLLDIVEAYPNVQPMTDDDSASTTMVWDDSDQGANHDDGIGHFRSWDTPDNTAGVAGSWHIDRVSQSHSPSPSCITHSHPYSPETPFLSLKQDETCDGGVSSTEYECDSKALHHSSTMDSRNAWEVGNEGWDAEKTTNSTTVCAEDPVSSPQSPSVSYGDIFRNEADCLPVLGEEGVFVLRTCGDGTKWDKIMTPPQTPEQLNCATSADDENLRPAQSDEGIDVAGDTVESWCVHQLITNETIVLERSDEQSYDS